MMKKPYTGKLARPRRPKPMSVGEMMDPQLREKWIAARGRDDTERIRLLCAHFQVAPTWDLPMHYALLMAVARQHVPGFQERRPPGAPVKWTLLVKLVLSVEIDALLAKGYDIEGAALKLAAQSRWKKFLRSVQGGTRANPREALRAAYIRFRRERDRDPTCRKWALASQEKYKNHEESGTLDEWQAFVDDALAHPHPPTP